MKDVKTNRESVQEKTEELNLNKQKFNGCIIVFISIIVFVVIGIYAMKILDHVPQKIDSQIKGEYTIKLYSTSSPVWPFGPQDCRIVLTRNNKNISIIDFELRNDGKSMNEHNWKVNWENDKVMVTIIGEEQKDEIYYLYYNGKTFQIEADMEQK